MSEDRTREVTVHARGEDLAWRPGDGPTRSLRDSSEDDVRATDLLLAALGICVAGTIQYFAENHGITALTGLSVAVAGTEVGPPTRLGAISVAVSLEGELSADEALRLRRAGTHCKIHQTLVAGVPVEFTA